MQNIDPQLLAQILAANGMDVGGYQLGRGNAIYDPAAGIDGPQRFEQAIYGNTNKDGWTTNGWDAWDTDGKYRGHGSGDSDALSTLKFLATAAAGYYGGNALADAGVGSGFSGAAAGGGAGSAASNAALMEAMGGTSAFTGGGGALAGGVGSAGSGASTLSQLGGAAKTAAGGLNAGGLVGAAAGALSSKDQTQSTNRDPWAPAQDFLKQQITQGQTLSDQYQKQPFSQAQQTAYGNYGGLLDAINKNAGGLIGGFNASASGANNYDRSNPRRQLTGGQPMSQMDLSSFMPGLLGNFGTRKG